MTPLIMTEIEYSHIKTPDTKNAADEREMIWKQIRPVKNNKLTSCGAMLGTDECFYNLCVKPLNIKVRLLTIISDAPGGDSLSLIHI